MNDRDPRPMPPEVQRAYREPIDLFKLLSNRVYSDDDGSDVYGDKDRRVVLDALLRSLLEKYGDAWVAVGGKEMSVSMLAKQMRAQPLKAIETLIDMPDYGGPEATLPMLAMAMQPRWARWWQSFAWTDHADVASWMDAAVCVLGKRQTAWLSAQYARAVIEQARLQDRRVCINAIEAAEAWSRDPSDKNWAKARSAAYAADVTADAAANVDADYADVEAPGAGAEANAVASAAAAAYIMETSSATASAAESGASYAGLCELTKRLITPTLVTSAARSSGAASSRSNALPAAMGALLGAGAMHLAKRS